MKRILLVDDEENIVATLQVRLEANGYEVITATDGLAALNRARSENPDLIILDIMLPKMNGYQVSRMLKFDENYKHIPIIMLTARAQEKDKEYGKETGANCYMTKPFEASELLAKIRELLGEG